MNSEKRILVIGDACNDEFVYGKCTRLCPDAPVPVFIPQEIVTNGGMGKNVQANVKSLGYKCDLICQSNLVTKTRYVDEKTNHTFLRVDTGEWSVDRVKGLTVELLNSYDAIIVSDYNKGFLHEEDIEFVCRNHPLVFIDTKKHINQFCSKAAYIKINEIEYNNSKDVLESDEYFDNLIVTLGDKGCRYKRVLFPVNKVEVKDMSGAGDTFMAALVCTYLKTQDIVQSIECANVCASTVVQKKGVVTIEKGVC